MHKLHSVDYWYWY